MTITIGNATITTGITAPSKTGQQARFPKELLKDQAPTQAAEKPLNVGPVLPDEFGKAMMLGNPNLINDSLLFKITEPAELNLDKIRWPTGGQAPYNLGADGNQTHLTDTQSLNLDIVKQRLGTQAEAAIRKHLSNPPPENAAIPLADLPPYLRNGHPAGAKTLDPLVLGSRMFNATFKVDPTSNMNVSYTIGQFGRNELDRLINPSR